MTTRSPHRSADGRPPAAPDEGRATSGTGVDRARRPGDVLGGDPPGGPRPASPVTAVAGVVAAGYVAITITMLLCGAIVTELVVGSWLGDLDRGITRWLAGSRWAPVDAATRVLSNLADTFTVIGTTVGAGAVLVATRLWRQATVLLAGLPLELGVFLSTTYAVGRPRPSVATLEALPSTASFPSGHMAASAVLYGGLALIVASLAPPTVPRRWLWTAAAVVVVGVGFSRVYRGLHNTIDVVGGAALGAGCLVVAVLAARFLPDEARHGGATGLTEEGT